MLVHRVHAENEASGSPPRAGSNAAAGIQPGHHPGLPPHTREDGEVKSKHCWDIRIVPSRCRPAWPQLLSATTLPCNRFCSQHYLLPLMESLPLCSGCSIQLQWDKPRCLLTGSRRDDGQGYAPGLYMLLVHQFLLPIPVLQDCTPQVDPLLLLPSAMMLVLHNHDTNIPDNNSAPSQRTAGPPGDVWAPLESTKEQHSSKEMNSGQLHVAIQAQHHHTSLTHRAAGSIFTCAWPLEEKDQRGPRTGQWHKHRANVADGICAGATAIAELVLAEVVPSCCHSTFCFLLKQGHSDDASIDLQRQEYLGSLPARSSLPARPPAVCKFTGNRIYSTY